jgi:hypothetical protein
MPQGEVRCLDDARMLSSERFHKQALFSRLAEAGLSHWEIPHRIRGLGKKQLTNRYGRLKSSR